MKYFILCIVVTFSVMADEEVTRSYYSENIQKGPLVKISQQQTKIKALIKEGDNLCVAEYFNEFPTEPLYFNFSKISKEITLQINQFAGKTKKGLACQVNGNVNCRRLIYEKDHLKCELAYFTIGKDVLNSVNIDFDGEIISDQQILDSQKLEEVEVCKTFLDSPLSYKKEID